MDTRRVIGCALVLCCLLMSACSAHEGGHLLGFFAPRSESDPKLGHGLLRARLAALCTEIEQDKLKEKNAKIGEKYHAASPEIQRQVDALLQGAHSPVDTSHPKE